MADSQKSPFGQFLGLSIVVLGIGSLVYLTSLPQNTKNVEIKYQKKSKSHNILQTLWERDFQQMKESNEMDDRLKQASQIRVFMLDKNLHKFFKGLNSPIKINSRGLYLLEVSFMSHHSELDGLNKIIIQYNLIENNTKEMLYEVSRTVTVPKNISL